VLSIDIEVSGFIDPSTCYGDPEFELAHMSLFGGFDDDNLKSYAKLRPLPAEFWSTRRYAYASYPALMHVLYFGDRYVPLLEEIFINAGV